MSEYRYNAPHEQRIGHADRDKTVDHLAARVASGHLTQDEFEQRRDKALQAVTRADLNQLTHDLPPDECRVPAKPKRYRTQVAGNAYPFSMTRWVSSVAFSMVMIVLPVPLMAHAWGGFGHSPLNGGAGILTLITGCVLLIVAGIGFSPDGYNRPDDSPPMDYY